VKKRVLQFIGSFNQGGSERQAVALTRLLSEESSYETRVAVLSGEGVLRAEVERLGMADIPEFPLSSFFSAGFLRQVVRCSEYLRSNNIDLVHTHDFYTNVFGMTAARLAGVKAKVASKRETLGMRTPNQVRVEKFAFAMADAIVINSEAVRDYLRKVGVAAKKLSLIYNGLDVDRFERSQSADLRVEHQISDDAPVVTLVANLRHHVKNVPMLLKAAKTVIESSPNAVFVIAGEGELQTELEQLASGLNITSNVKFLGRCSDVPALLSISDICVLTSTAEGFSNSILEYMAAGKPVIATDVGGAREVVKHGVTGYLVASDDHQKLAEHLLELVNDNVRSAEFGEAGRKIVKERFSEKAQLESTLALYDSLLK